MNLKQTLVRGLAVVGIVTAISAPAAFAATDDPYDNSKNAEVSVTTPGVFNVYFYGANALDLGDVELLASSPDATRTGTVWVEYTDTQADRGAFSVAMSASDFTYYSQTISASYFTISTVYNVIPALYGGGHSAFGLPNGNWGPLPLQYSGSWIHNASAGIGTGTAEGQVDLSLYVPNTTLAGDYTSTLTLTVSPPSP